MKVTKYSVYFHTSLRVEALVQDSSASTLRSARRRADYSGNNIRRSRSQPFATLDLEHRRTKSAMHSITEVGSNVPAFLAKLWKLVEDTDFDELICWSEVSLRLEVQLP